MHSHEEVGAPVHEVEAPATSPARVATSEEPSVGPKRARRADIQGLRAVAVLLVVAYHAFPSLVRGGFVGVDVFFVISGYLITGLLLRELNASGRIRFGAFYARRLRRLLPAALTVTVVTLFGAAMFYGPLRLLQVLGDATWATLSLANVNFGMSPDGYFATTAPSPFLHFWSLSVEEQFYLLWPLLLVGSTLIGKRWGIPALLAVVLAGSLVVSILLTAAGNPIAYFSLASRAWELAVGGALAWATTLRPHSASSTPSRARQWVPIIALVAGALAVAAVLRVYAGTGIPRWALIAPLLAAGLVILAPRLNAALPGIVRLVTLFAGLGLIVASAVRLSDATPFPSWSALLPTIGAALVIASGIGGRAPAPWLLANPVARYIGDISYSLYLWHWPLLVLGTAMLGNSVSIRFGLVVIAFGLAALSYQFIEKGFGRLRRNARPRRVVAIGVVAALVFAGGFVGVAAAIPVNSGKPAPELPSSMNFNAGPGYIPDGVPSNVTPSLADLESTSSLSPMFTNGCFAEGLKVCEGGDPHGTKTVVLAGDSHAGMWWPAFDIAAKKQGWRLFIVGKNGCPIVDVPVSAGATADEWPACAAWQSKAVPAVADLHPDLIIVDNLTAGYMHKASLRDDFFTTWPPALTETLQRLGNSAPVMLMGPEPSLSAAPGDCLLSNLNDISPCNTPIAAAVPQALRDISAQSAAAAGATLIDPTKVLCTQTECPAISYNLIMYRDGNHLTVQYAKQLAPWAQEILANAKLR